MSFGDPNNPYGQQPQQPPQGQPGYGYPQQAPQGVPQQGYGYPQQPGQYPQQPGQYPQAPPVSPYGQQPGYGAPGYGQMPELAHWGLRFAGALLDGVIILVPYYVLLAIGVAMSDPSGSGGAAVVGIIGVVYAIGMGLYNIYLEGKTGQSIGKKALKIRVLKEADGATLGFGMAFVRKLAHILDGLPCYIGYLWPLWDSKKQTFADKVCSTVVVRA
ncbi:RDD family protein [Streptomyces sp. NPDC002133]|uniref:RDD family protein n=1 Tax=Streptomyces sp. NPDC002133 TaxID=3154409 RepID=UPI00332B3207